MSQTLSEAMPQVAQPRLELAEGSFIAHDDLSSGLMFEYRVRAEKGPYGDFPEKQAEEFTKKELEKLTLSQRLDRFHNPATELRHQFQLHGHWIVRAGIISAEKDGHRALFNVFEDGNEQIESLMTVGGVILPRPGGKLLQPEHYGSHPVQEGFATIVDYPTINTRPSKDGLRYVIPARNILAGTLKIIYSSANRTTTGI
jgi:hypothetical protein